MNYETKDNLQGFIAIILAIILFIITCWLTSCRPAGHKEYKTYGEYLTDTVSYDSIAFNSMKAELEFCKEADDFKYELLEHSFNCIDILDIILDDINACDKSSYTPIELEDLLLKYGYYDEIEKLDSIINNKYL